MLKAPPFQTSETGWGAFEISIDVHLHDSTAPPIRLTHLLKLFESSSSSPAAALSSSDALVVSEHYDELVFTALPESAAARSALLAGPSREPPVYPFAEHLASFSAESDLAAIDAARRFMAERLAELEDRLFKARAAAAAYSHKHLLELGLF